MWGAVVEDLEQSLASDPEGALSPPCIVAYHLADAQLEKNFPQGLRQPRGSLTPPAVLATGANEQ